MTILTYLLIKINQNNSFLHSSFIVTFGNGGIRTGKRRNGTKLSLS